MLVIELINRIISVNVKTPWNIFWSFDPNNGNLALVIQNYTWAK
jgi:hypothetical protein